jgi:hypothetical protein
MRSFFALAARRFFLSICVAATAWFTFCFFFLIQLTAGILIRRRSAATAAGFIVLNFVLFQDFNCFVFHRISF